MTNPLILAIASIAVGISTILVVVGLVSLLFLNPLWIGFEQGRSDVAALTGWSRQDVATVTGAILRDVTLGPPDFTMSVRGEPVFDERERGHMQDVRRAFVGFGAAGVVAAAILVAARLWSRGAAWYWRSVATGALILVGSTILLGAFAAFAFDTAFELFHQVLFAGGTYTFDPTTERLVQLFPEQLWYESAIAIGLLLVVASLVVTWYALRRLRGAAEVA